MRERPNYESLQFSSFETSRLSLEPVSTDDSEFIFELTNTDGWIRFIGDRGIHSLASAADYIQKLLENPAMNYWVVKIKADQTKIGIVTYIKKEYLVHPDIGFALLPAYEGSGFAYEASGMLLKEVQRSGSPVWATTVPENTRSIQLLKKLGMHFEKELAVEGEILHVYALEP
ncbi:MAG: GNAT family N-acetyltransferase [Cytophagales bacterium]|nr:GNAT family N-acetyltransferase [Cytophagales bacterium]